MKKILFLMLIMGFFSPLINAYEYLYFDMPSNEGLNNARYQFFVDSDGRLKNKFIRGNGEILIQDSNFIAVLGQIQRSNGRTIITKNVLDSYFHQDLQFLNDFYTQKLDAILNYFYNHDYYNATNYLHYDNYELLYNEEGLVVESIVDGVWAGLYDDSQKSKSGALYNKNGSLIYYNGKEVTPAISFFVWLQKFTNKVVIETFEEIQRSLISGIIAAVVLVLAIVRLVLELLPSSITPRRRRYYGGGRGSLPDYGDGSQVAASVRARLAAKNRALKARAYDRSGVEESTVNGILFDLENDR